MKRRNECMENLRTSARWRLQNEFNKDNPKYVETLKNLIIQVSVPLKLYTIQNAKDISLYQGMIKLLEEEVQLKVREDEVSLVKGMISECQSKYSEILKNETHDQREYNCTLTVIEDKFLTQDEGGLCGGVVLYAHHGKIVCPNTLEDRLNLVFEQELPQLRKGLFPKPRESQQM